MPPPAHHPRSPCLFDCLTNDAVTGYYTTTQSDFLLIRGPHAFLGHGWLGCSRIYEVPEQINWDYGEPVGMCKETAPNSGIFHREWTKATIEMNCNTWTPTITMKK